MKSKLPQVILILFFLSAIPIVHAEPSVEIEYFHNPRCSTCLEYDKVIEKLEKEFDEQVNFIWLDLNEQKNAEKFTGYNLTSIPSSVINGEYRFPQEYITKEILRYYINQILSGSDIVSDSIGASALSVPLILLSGFIDGINPCAFATMIFFLSFLFSIQKTKKRVLETGAYFIFGVFLVYLALGFGIIETVTLFGVRHLFSQIGLVILVILGILNIRDGLSQGGDLIKFPSIFVSGRLSKSLKSIQENNAVAAASLLLGGIVSISEFGCTGGVYIGILSLIYSYSRFWQGVFYLILYNLMFILPLIILLLLAFNEKTLKTIEKWTNKNMKKMKVATGIFMISLAFVSWFLIFSPSNPLSNFIWKELPIVPIPCEECPYIK
jgi:cytochrome c biogenesis protein CcdA